MAINDPIADLLTRIRNAALARNRFVDLYHSREKASIVKVLQEQGFVDNFLVDEAGGRMRIFLKYGFGRQPVIQGLKRVSSPGLRRYVGYRNIPRIFGGLGVAILSTPSGILDGKKAREQKVGGELLCLVW
ncbi:MAG: 30S ribosomal protein S8 [Chlamydiales bacterium]|nr:30S ribosomal protein S8 [Chlamydiales bacterium]